MKNRTDKHHNSDDEDEIKSDVHPEEGKLVKVSDKLS